MCIILLVLTVTVGFAGVYVLWTRRKLYFLSWQLPGPPALLPIIGNGFAFLCKAEDLLDRVIKITKPYPSPFRLWLGPRLVTFIKDPDHLQIIMKSPKMSTKAFVYKFLEPFMGKGLFTSSGLQHKNQRRLLQPFFSPKILEGYSHLFQKHATNLVQLLQCHVKDRDTFDVLPLLHESAFEATMDILIEDKNDHSIDYKTVPHYVRRFYHIFSQRVISFWLYPDCLFKLSNFYKEQQKMIKIATTLTEDVKAARLPDIIKRIETKEINKNEIRTPSLLELMVEMVYEQPECLNESEFLDHIMTFVATSQDTQSSALAFTLMMLGMHPDIQEKVLNEINEVCGNQSGIDINETEKLKYMEMCLNESMRLFPLGPFLPRDVTEDFDMGKWTLPANSSVILSVWDVHRDPRFWEYPDKYYPEHFAEEACSKRHPYAFLPFSAGPRRCIAQKYSYTNMKIILFNILKKYKIECPTTLKALKLMTDVSIRPIGGYRIKINNRKFCEEDET